MHQRPASLWRNQDYLLLWSGQAVSSVGTEVSQLAFPLLILALTGSPAQAGFASALRFLPYLIFTLPAGALVDRWDRKQVMLLCDTGRALSLASIPVVLALGHLTLIQLYAVSTIEGTLFVFFNLAETACLPRVVSQEQLPIATAQNSVTQNLSVLLGPPLGGVLYLVGQSLPFLADAISYAVSVLSLLFIQTPFQEQRTAPSRNLWREIQEGFQWLWHQPLIRFLAILTGGINITTSSLGLIVIVFAQHLHASPFAIGLIFAGGGVGGILGAIVTPFFQKRLHFGPMIMSTLWFWAFLWMVLAITPNVVLLSIVTGLTFAAASLYDIVQFSYRVARTPDVLQGRVSSVVRLFTFSGPPLGLALTGVLLQAIGIVPTILIYACFFLVIAGAATLNTHVRHAPPLTESQIEKQ